MREDPQSYIPDLQAMIKHFKGVYYKVPGTNINIITSEGVKAVENAIEFLKS